MADAINQYGDRGISAHLPSSDNVNESVNSVSDIVDKLPYLIFRAYDEGKDNEVRIDATIPVSIQFRVGITFCPWCGKRLID